jgi:hypothetical protein
MSGARNLSRRWLRAQVGWLLAALIAAASPILAADDSPQVGSRHVSFTLPAIDDFRPVSLEQFRGQKVLLIQFASW